MGNRVCSLYLTEEKAWLAVLKKGGKAFLVEEFLPLSLGEVEAHLRRLSLPTRASFYSRDTVFGMGEFPPGKETLLELHIRKAVTETGLLQGTFLLRYRVLEKSESFYRTAYIALPIQRRQFFLQHLSPGSIPLEGLYPAESSLAALVAQTDPKPSGIILPTPQGYDFIFAQEGNVVYTRSITLFPEGERERQIAEALQETLSFLRRTISFVPQNLYPLDSASESSLEHLEESHSPKHLPLEDLVQPLPQGDLHALAILVGNLLVPSRFNLLDATYLADQQAKRWSRVIHLGALVCALLLLIISLWQGQDLLRLRQRYLTTYNRLQREVAQIMKVQPKEEEIQRVKRFLEIYRAYNHQPKLDKFLLWLSIHLPSRATVTSMEAQPYSPPSPNTPNQPSSAGATPSLPSIDRLMISMEGEIQGDYQEVKREFYLFIGELEKRASITNSRLVYGEGKGLFHLEIEYGERWRKTP